jgi:DNA-binding NarL/FixJ family response regulator
VSAGASNGSAGVRVLIVESRELIAAGLEHILNRNGVDVVGLAAEGREAIPVARATAPDLVLMHLDLPDMSGIQVGRRLLYMSPAIKLLLLTEVDDGDGMRRALEAGFHGCLSLTSSVSRIVRSIERVGAGEDVWPRHLASDSDLAQVTNEDEYAYLLSTQLTDREREVLRLLAVGMRNDRIAEVLFVSPHTVRTHVQNIRTKLRVRSRLEAAVFALRHGLAKPGLEARSA